ncbi:hypothetical protein BELL_0034g00290 [Botrytis elliptica]|uniref:Uncharacterized protein n=1 Tax=Botrytis elliptica TaxID=278938 RepID=A0A4Z1KDD2_9HELO|nr:hypothetical protein BELL_0034g00290 [Botrytis elliptica]
MRVVVIAKTSLGYLQLASIQNRHGLIHDVLFNLCANIIKIYSSSANRIQIQHELGSATLIRSRDDLTSNHRRQTMFPFIQTCLAIGFTFIPSIGYEAANDTISMEEFDPDLGRSRPYLVFDITNLKDIGYCFFHVGSFKWNSLGQMHAPCMTPLSASVFFAGGHHASKGRRTMTPYQNYDKSLDQFRVIDAHILSDTWPRGIWMVLVGDTYDLLSNHPQDSPAKHSFRQRYAFIKAKEHGAHAEANAGQECTGSVAFVKSYEPQLVVADIDQFLQQAVTGEEDEMIIKPA